MSLDLSPESASILEREASRAGVSVDTLVQRTFGPRPIKQQILPRDRSDEEKRAAVLAYINASDEEITRRHASSITHLQAKLDAAADATPEEIAIAEAEWQTQMQAMNENRRATGERLLYPEAVQP